MKFLAILIFYVKLLHFSRESISLLRVVLPPRVEYAHLTFPKLETMQTVSAVSSGLMECMRFQRSSYIGPIYHPDCLWVSGFAHTHVLGLTQIHTHTYARARVRTHTHTQRTLTIAGGSKGRVQKGDSLTENHLVHAVTLMIAGGSEGRN